MTEYQIKFFGDFLDGIDGCSDLEQIRALFWLTRFAMFLGFVIGLAIGVFCGWWLFGWWS